MVVRLFFGMRVCCLLVSCVLVVWVGLFGLDFVDFVVVVYVLL